jgi:hypothetical protein
MAITANLADACDAISGGIRRIAFISLTDVAEGAISQTSGEVTSITLATAIEWRENGEMVNGSLKYTEELEFYIRGNNTANRVAIVALVEDLCGVLAIVEDSNGTIFLLGWSEDLDLDRPLKMASDASGSGKELTDLAGSTITMACMSPKKAYPITGITWATLTTPAL